MIGNIDHKAASGLSLETPAPAQSEEWELCEGTESAGIEHRFVKGRKWYRAVARIDDPRYQGEVVAIGKEYRAVDQADPVRVAGYAVNPMAEQYQNDLAAGIARSHMDPAKDASLSDMRRYLRELESDLMYPYKLWQMKLARHIDRLAATALLRETIALMLADITEYGPCDEHTTFIEQLGALLSRKSE